MGLRRMKKTGDLFNTTVWSVLSDKIMDDYHKRPYSLYFKPYNELDLSKLQETSEPKNMMEKLGLSPSHYQVLCQVLNGAFAKSSEALLISEKKEITPEDLKALLASHPVQSDVNPSKSNEEAGKEEKGCLTKAEEERVLGDVSSPFDEIVKKHLLKVIPSHSYKTWIVETNAVFETTDWAWQVKAKNPFSQSQIEANFGQFVDHARKRFLESLS